jgi:hypothetical protein
MGSAALTKNSIVAVGKDQVSCDMVGESAILDLKSGQYYGLNPIGTRIWALIQKPTPVADILATLLNEYEVDAERCERDLLMLLGQLEKKGLVEISCG